MTKSKIKVFVAVAVTGWIRYELARTLLELTQDRRYSLEFLFQSARPISTARHAILNEFLRSEADYLLMLDSDVIPYHSPLDLVELDLDVVAMACPIWRPGCSPPIVLNTTPVDGSKTVTLCEGAIAEVTQTSTGGIVIARRVIGHPNMKNPFVCVYDGDGLLAVDDDVSFYQRARAAGFRIYVSLDHVCGHVKEVDIVTIANAVARWSVVGTGDPDAVD